MSTALADARCAGIPLVAALAVPFDGGRDTAAAPPPIINSSALIAIDRS